MMNTEAIEKRLAGIESLAELMLQECCKARLELGLVKAPAPRKGSLAKTEIMKVVHKRRKTAMQKVS